MDNDILIEKAKKIQNPYKWNDSSITEKLFWGRERELSIFDNIINEIDFTSNFYITGPKSIGKSSLIKFIKERFQNDYAVAHIELSRANDNLLDKKSFFGTLISEIIDQNYSDEDEKIFETEEKINKNNFLSQRNQKIWNDLRNYGWPKDRDISEDESIDSLLPFELCKNWIKDVNNPIFDDRIINKTFNKMINDLSKLPDGDDKNGLVLIIDEAQELINAPSILELLDRATKQNEFLLLICSGLELKYISNTKRESIEKFIKNSQRIQLSGLDSDYYDDFIYSPLTQKLKCQRKDIQFISNNLINQIHDKSNGNPRHIQMILEEAFNYFKEKEDSTELVINEYVIDSILGKYEEYSTNSTIFTNALDTIEKQLLQIFSEKYLLWQSMNLKQALLLENAFNNVNDEVLTDHYDVIKKDLLQLGKHRLLELYSIPKKEFMEMKYLDDIELDDTINYRIIFNGDPIDKIFISYKIEKRLKCKLNDHAWKDNYYEDLIALKISNELPLQIYNREVVEDNNSTNEDSKSVQLVPMVKDGEHDVTTNLVRSSFGNGIQDWSKYNIDSKKIKKLGADRKSCEQNINKIQEFVKQYHLSRISLLSNQRRSKGWHRIIIDINVKDVEKSISVEFEIPENTKEIQNINKVVNNYQKYYAASFDDYDIEIVKINIITLHQPLLIVVNNSYSISFFENLVDNINEEKFEEAKAYAAARSLTSMTYGKGDIQYVNKEDHNNYAYTHILCGDYESAKQLLEGVNNPTITSQINTAYCYFMMDEKEKAVVIYKKLVRWYNKNKNDSQAFLFIQLCIKHKNISENYKKIKEVPHILLIYWNCMLTLNSSSILADEVSFLQKIINKKNIFIKVLSTKNESSDLIDYDSLKIIDRRVSYWVDYYSNDRKSTDNIIDSAENLYLEMDEDHYLYSSIENDLKIFTIK
jgi:hypothetical protein